MLPLAQFVAHQVRDREPTVRRVQRRTPRPSLRWLDPSPLWAVLRPQPRRARRRA